MSDINVVVLTGNLTRDPELKGATSASVLKFSIASNRSVKQQNGSYSDVPNFIDCTIFGKRADALANVLTKGMKVSLEGELRYSSWTDKDGNNRAKLEVVCQNIVLPPRTNKQAYSNAGAQQNQPKQAQQAQTYQQEQIPTYTPTTPAAPYSAPQQAPAPDVYDEDIPF